MELHRSFGRRVRYLRHRAGLTQKKLGAAVGLSGVTISNIERGVYPPGFARLQDLARALGIEVHQLFQFDEST